MSSFAWSLLVLVIGGLSALSGANSARILAVLPLASKSHSMWHFSLFRLLTARGHHVEVYAILPPLRHVENVTFVDLSSAFKDPFTTYEDYVGMFTSFDPNFLWKFGDELSEGVLAHEHVRRLLSSGRQFDLVFLEALLGQEAMLVFGHHFKAPVINLQGFPTWSGVNWAVGNPLAVSYAPENLAFDYSDTMTFFERLDNALAILKTLIAYHLYHLPKQQEIVDRLYNGEKSPPLTKMVEDISLTFTNTIPTLEYPRPYTPNVIPIGGAHIDPHSTPLAQDIKKFMDEASEGVIYFSLGTVVPTHLMPKEFIQAFVDAFRTIPKKILWKTDLKDIPGLSKNVKLAKWVSQPSVLAHPNCQLFMTHGGLFSQHEALYAGKPVVAIPFFADQRYNVRFYEHLGVGLKLDPAMLNSRSVHAAVTTALNDPRFGRAAERVARLVRELPISPAHAFVFWVEYVLRHGGARHLRPASASAPCHQLFHLDLLLAFVAAVLGAVTMLVFIIKLTFSWFGKDEAIRKKLR